MSEKAIFIESSREKRLLIRDGYKYFLAYESKKSEISRWRWRSCLTKCQAVMYTNKTEEIVADELHKNIHPNNFSSPKKINRQIVRIMHVNEKQLEGSQLGRYIVCVT